MVATTTTTGEGWSSRTAFILAAVGAAVGLGNIWRFPTLAGESGGGAFVIFYIGCVFLLGLPLVLSEIFIGKVGQTDAIGSIRRVAAPPAPRRLERPLRRRWRGRYQSGHM